MLESSVDTGTLLTCGFLIGLAKGGVLGSGRPAVPLLALAFGARASTGIILPMLIVGDLIAVRAYRQEVVWATVLRFLPWALLGIVLALVVGGGVSDAAFGRILAGSVLAGLGFLWWQHGSPGVPISDRSRLAIVFGVTGGFASMIGNTAGPILAVYLLGMGVSKLRFLGTQAGLFLVINVVKVPLHMAFWRTISLRSLSISAVAAPAVVVGAWLGVRLVRRIPEKPYRVLVVTVTAVSALVLMY